MKTRIGILPKRFLIDEKIQRFAFHQRRDNVETHRAKFKVGKLFL